MTRIEFINDIKAEIRVQAKSLEKIRNAYMVWLVAGIGVASFALTLALLFVNPEGIDMRYTVTFGALFPSALIYLLLSRMYLRRAHKNFIDGLCRASGFAHREDGCFAVSAMEKHKILPHHNKNRLETGLQGSYKGTPVAIQEVILTELKQDPSHKKKQKEYLRFWGLLVRLQLTRRTDGHTVIIPRAAMKTFFRNDFSQYGEVKITGNGKFEKIYEVVATDPLEAKFIANPAFREKFMAAGKALNVYWSEASFRETEILFAFQRFRPFVSVTPLWKPVTEQHLRRCADELEAIVQIIDTLKANPQIGI